MKTLVAIILLSLAWIFASTGTLLLSQTNGGIYFGAFDLHSSSVSNNLSHIDDTPLRYDGKIELKAYCNTQDLTRLMIPVSNARFVRFRMFDANSNAVPQTRSGKTWGGHFDSFPKSANEKFGERMVPWIAVSPNNLSTGLLLPAPKELFELKRPGIYTMTIEVHCRRRTMVGTNQWLWEPVTTPPLALRVVVPTNAYDSPQKIPAGSAANSGSP